MNSYNTYLRESEQIADIADTLRVGEKVAISDYHLLKKDFVQLKDYVDAIHKQLLMLNLPEKALPSWLRRNHFGGKTLLIIGSDKGIVGNAHHRLLGEFVEHSAEYQKVFVVGRRVAVLLSEIGYNEYEMLLTEQDGSEKYNLQASQLLMEVLLSHERTQCDGPIDLLYPSYKSISECAPTFVTLLPLISVPLSSEAVRTDIGIPLFEPNKRSVGTWLLNRYIELELHRVLVEAELSLLTARMLSMEHVATQAEGLSHTYRSMYAKLKRRVVSQRQIETYVINMLVEGKT